MNRPVYDISNGHINAGHDDDLSHVCRQLISYHQQQQYGLENEHNRNHNRRSNQNHEGEKLMRRIRCEVAKVKGGQSYSQYWNSNTYHSTRWFMKWAIFVVFIGLVLGWFLNGQAWNSMTQRRCLLPSHPIVMEIFRPLANCSICLNKTDNLVLEFQGLPSKKEFSKVAYSSKPIIIRSGGKATGMPETFNFAKLRQIFESEKGGVETVTEECQFLPFRSPFVSLREAFDRISDTTVWEQPWYIGWSNCHPGVATKLRSIFPRPDFLPDDSESSAIDWIFIGSPGLGAAMHIDYVKRPSWQAQLSGVKTWVLRPAPECEELCPETIKFTIFPGDMLFLETNMWYHETFIEGSSLSISIGSEYD